MFLPFSEQAKKELLRADLKPGEEAVHGAKNFIESVIMSNAKEVSQGKGGVEDAATLALCKAILSLCPYYVLSRFADKYSKLWANFFSSNPQAAHVFAQELFPSLSGNKVNVFEFLKAEESISLREVSQGFVHLPEQELLDVIANQVRKKVMQVPVSAEKPQAIQEAARVLSKQFVSPLPKTSFLQREEIRKIRSGLPEGQRFYGCMKLCRACFKDNTSFEDAAKVLSEYVAACAPGSTPFTEREALACLEWVYRKGNKL